jgi:hypothetical protein
VVQHSEEGFITQMVHHRVTQRRHKQGMQRS